MLGRMLAAGVLRHRAAANIVLLAGRQQQVLDVQRYLGALERHEAAAIGHLNKAFSASSDGSHNHDDGTLPAAPMLLSDAALMSFVLVASNLGSLIRVRPPQIIINGTSCGTATSTSLPSGLWTKRTCCCLLFLSFC